MPLQIIEVLYKIQSKYNLDAAQLHSIIFWRKDQFEIRELMAVQWKNQIMWNPTIPQDQKFSTVGYLQNFQVYVKANHRDADIWLD